MQGGRRYLSLLLATSVGLLLPAVFWVYHSMGTTDFVAGGLLANAGFSNTTLLILALLFTYGIGKAAVMPFHQWLPAAMVAPTPVSALLHAVAVVKAGVFSLLKVVVYIFGIDLLAGTTASEIMVILASTTIITASLIAIRQDNLKRRLAYSTISQLSYVVLATALMTPWAITAAAIHIAAHAFGKISLFFAAGAIYTAAHKSQVSQLNGIGWRMPITMTVFSIGAISMIGLPPVAGFISKWYLLLGATHTEQWLAIGVVILSTLLNAAYFIPIMYAAWFKASDDDESEHGEAPKPMLVAMLACSVLTVGLFFYPDIFWHFADAVANLGIKP